MKVKNTLALTGMIWALNACGGKSVQPIPPQADTQTDIQKTANELGADLKSVIDNSGGDSNFKPYKAETPLTPEEIKKNQQSERAAEMADEFVKENFHVITIIGAPARYPIAIAKKFNALIGQCSNIVNLRNFEVQIAGQAVLTEERNVCVPFSYKCSDEKVLSLRLDPETRLAVNSARMKAQQDTLKCHASGIDAIGFKLDF